MSRLEDAREALRGFCWFGNEGEKFEAALAELEQAVREMAYRLQRTGSDNSPSTSIEPGLGDDEAELLYMQGYRRGREDGYAEGWRESQKEMQS